MTSGRSRPRRLLSIGHSYVVSLNRRLPQEIARESNGTWEVTAVAPSFVQSALRPIDLERQDDEQLNLEIVPAHLTGVPQLLFYGRRLRELLGERWDFVHCWEEPYVLAGGQVAWSISRETPWVFYTAQNLDKHYLPPFGSIERFCVKRCAGWNSGRGSGGARTIRPRLRLEASSSDSAWGGPCRVQARCRRRTFDPARTRLGPAGTSDSGISRQAG